MCGLIALWDPVAPLSRGALDAGVDALRSRGPDGSGQWWSAARDVALGHARLAIVDVTGGAQPIANEDGSVVAMLNGELYDTAGLRAGLEARGHRLRTRCDAELLVHLYEELGAEFADGLRGEFACVLYDVTRRRLVAARDRDGVRPLYLARSGTTLRLASTARALFAAGHAPGFSADALSRAAALQYPGPSETLFAGITPLAAGAVWLAERDGVRVRSLARAWADSALGGVTRSGPADAREAQVAPRRVTRLATAAHAQLRAALDEAVRVRIPDEVSFACALSGGLDSSAVLALATRARGVAPPAFTVRFAGDLQCEWALAADTARRFEAPHHEVALDAVALADLLPRVTRDAEGSAINAHVVGKWALARAVARAGHRVLLCGEGADEVAFGYPHFLVDAGLAPTDQQRAALGGAMLAETGPPACAGVSSDLWGALTEGLPSFVSAKLALGARIHALGRFGDFVSNAREALGRWARAVDRVDVNEAKASAFDVCGSGEGTAAISRLAPADDVLERSRAWWRASAFERYILSTLGDAVELAHGVEARPPFLDREVQRACAAFSPSAFVYQGVEKWPLREALTGTLPDAARARRKQPFFASPMLLAERPGPLFDLAQATLTGARAPAFVDRAAVARTLERLRTATLAERRAWEGPLMWLLTTALLESELLA